MTDMTDLQDACTRIVDIGWQGATQEQRMLVVDAARKVANPDIELIAKIACNAYWKTYPTERPLQANQWSPLEGDMWLRVAQTIVDAVFTPLDQEDT
jgi:hypothetical protein